MMPRFLLAVVLLLSTAAPAFSQTTGSCELGTAEAELHVNNVRAKLQNIGGLFWRGGNPLYNVPATSSGNPNAIFAHGIWVAGMVDGELRTAAAQYANWEFWPGPLDESGNPPADCSLYDRIYSVTEADVAAYEAGAAPTDDLRDWPVDLGAPVVDGDGVEGNYDLEGGDRPEILGTQAAFWVMNDAGNVHETTETPPIGLEVRVTAFAAASATEAINDATLYRYELVYKGDAPLEDAYFGLWSDTDLGNAGDDFVGSDTTYGLGYTYNGDEMDSHYGIPPALGFDFLEGPTSESGEELGMEHFLYYISDNTPQGELSEASDYYNYLRGHWQDGTPMTLGGTGYGGETPIDYMFPGDPVTQSFWSEENVDGEGARNTPADRRFVMSTGPFTMEPGESETIVYSIVWARGEDRLDSITELRAASETVEAAYAGGFDVEPPAPVTQAPTLVAPAPGVTGQPVNLTLLWEEVPHATQYELQIATDAAFEDLVVEEFNFDIQLDVEVPAEALLQWRVRGTNFHTTGPWSEAGSFSTSDELLTQGGLLLFEDTNGAEHPAIVELQAPGGGAACEDGDTSIGCDGVGGDLVDFSLNSTQVYFRTSQGEGSEGSLAAFAPNDYEIRFTAPEDGSYAYHAFSTGAIARVPFQIWDVGNEPPFSEPDPSDDVRLVPAIFSDGGGECAFDFGESTVSGYTVTDRIYAYYPTETYADWADQAATQLGEEDCVAPEDFPADDLIDFDRGRPLEREVIGQFNAALTVADLEGAVIRYWTTPYGLLAPVPSAPADEAAGLQTTLTFAWTAPPGTEAIDLQVADDRHFTQRVVDEEGLAGSSFAATVSDDEGYFWRVRARDGSGVSDWSPVWRFATGSAEVSTELPAGIPADYTVQAPFPNPAASHAQIRFGVPEAADATLSVYDVLGRRVATLAQGRYGAGWHEAEVDAASLAAGVYVVRLEADSAQRTQSLVVVK